METQERSPDLEEGEAVEDANVEEDSFSDLSDILDDEEPVKKIKKRPVVKAPDSSKYIVRKARPLDGPPVGGGYYNPGRGRGGYYHQGPGRDYHQPPVVR